MKITEILQELLECLKVIALDYCPTCGCDLCNTQGCPSCPKMRAARAALAKAEGREYQEPPVLPADDINRRNALMSGVEL